MPNRWMTWLGQYNRNRGNVLKFSMLFFGLLGPPVVALLLEENGGVGFWTLLVVASLVTGYLWGVVMWATYFKHLSHRE